MLVLSRKSGQSVRVGNDVRIVIVRIEKGRVRIGIDAPGHVLVAREELDPLDAPCLVQRNGRVTSRPERGGSPGWGS